MTQTQIDPTAEQRLLSSPWYGNFKTLLKVIEAAQEMAADLHELHFAGGSDFLFLFEDVRGDAAAKELGDAVLFADAQLSQLAKRLRKAI